MSKHTKGPWRRGKGYNSIVSDHPAPGIRGSEDVDAYGGHMICESINGPNGDLVIAAPDLLEAIVKLLTAIGNICGAFHITESDLLEEDTGAVEACNFSDEVLKKAKGIA